MAASVSRGGGWWRPCALSAGTGCHLSGLGPSGPVSLGGAPGDRSPGAEIARQVVRRSASPPRRLADVSPVRSGKGRTDDPRRAWAAPAFGPEAGGASWALGGEGAGGRPGPGEGRPH